TVPVERGVAAGGLPLGGQARLDGLPRVFVALAAAQAQAVGRAVVVEAAPGFVVGLLVVVLAPEGFLGRGVHRFARGLAGEPAHHRTDDAADGGAHRAGDRAGRGTGDGAAGRADGGADGMGSGFFGDG